MFQALKTTLKAFPVITLVTVALCYITGAAAQHLFGISLDDQASVEQVRQAITCLVRRLCGNAGWKWVFFKDVGSLLYVIAWIVAIMPVIEEIVFRWLLWKLPRPGLPIVPAITSSLLFTAAHYIEMPWPNNAFVALFFFGLAQCWLYQRTGRLWCAMLNHGLFNAANLVLAFAIPS